MITKLYITAQQALIDFKNDQRGVTGIEYAIIAAAISTALLAGFGASGSITGALTTAMTTITTAISGGPAPSGG